MFLKPAQNHQAISIEFELNDAMSSFRAAQLIGNQVVRINLSNLQPFSSSVRELSVFFYGDGQWKNKRSADGAAMRDARIARRTNGRNCKMVVVSV